MSTNFPSALDTFTNPNGSDSLNAAAVPHAEQHANANDAIEALQAKVGINGSAVATSLDYRISAAETGLGGKISSSEKGSANGVATLGFDGKVPSSQLPPLDYIPTSEKGVSGGVAGLDEAGKVPAAQLPSYVDDVLEYANLAAFPVTGEAGKIYVALDTNKTYRWSGSTYIYITSGAVDSVAGKTGVVVLAKADVGLGSVDNTSDADKPVSAAAQAALNLKADAASPTTTGTLTHSGDIVLSGSGKRITGDFSNATVANRAMFQTSTVNGATRVGVLPNGTSQISALDLHSTFDAANYQRLTMAIVGGSDGRIGVDQAGTGTFLPMTFYTGGSERMRIDTGGNVRVTSPAGLGYGTGAGGTVTQATSKSTAVTLNKPTGQITMNNASLAAGASVEFIVNNNLVTSNDTVIVNPVAGTYAGAASTYRVSAVPSLGLFYVVVTNQSGTSYSEAFKINFAIIKGASS